MQTLNYELKQLCKHNRDGSFAAQANRERISLVAPLFHTASATTAMELQLHFSLMGEGLHRQPGSAFVTRCMGKGASR